jgi:hypothetical protein
MDLAFNDIGVYLVQVSLLLIGQQGLVDFQLLLVNKPIYFYTPFRPKFKHTYHQIPNSSREKGLRIGAWGGGRGFLKF